MDGNTYYRAPLTYPHFDALLPSTRAAVISANLLIQDFLDKPWALQNVADFCKSEEFNKIFQHPLSEHYKSRNDCHTKETRTDKEKKSVLFVRNILIKYLQEDHHAIFPDFVAEAGRATYGPESRLRKGSIGIKKDNEGDRVIFIPSQDIEQSLNVLWEHLKEEAKNHTNLFGAVKIAAGLLNAHPLSDGNGRLSRVLMNILFGCNNKNYIPLYEFHSNSAGGFVIRLRQAEIYNEWDEIIQFYCNIVFCMAQRDSL